MMEIIRDRINETILSSKDKESLVEKFNNIRSVRNYGLSSNSEAIPLGIQASLVARASDGKALNFDGGEIWGLCSGCTRRNLLLKEEFSLHERKLPLFTRRCNRCVNESRLQLALAVQKARRKEFVIHKREESYHLRAIAKRDEFDTIQRETAQAAQIADDLGFFEKGSAIGSQAAASAAAKQMTLIDAVCNGYLDVVIAILADDPLAGAKLNLQTGRNALHEVLAATSSPLMSSEIRFHMLACMLEAGQDPNARTMLGKERPLHFAVKLLDEAPKIVQTLLAYGGLHSGLNSYGDTPLHVCCFPTTATILMNAGASSREVNKFGNTPYASALNRLHESQLLVEEMEKKLGPVDSAPADFVAQLGVMRNHHFRCLEMVKFWINQGERSVRDLEGKKVKAAEKQSIDRAVLDQQREIHIKKANDKRIQSLIIDASDDYQIWLKELNRGRSEIKKRLADEEKHLKKHGLR